MRDLLHRRTRPPFRFPEDLQLLHEIVLVLPGKPRETREALALLSMASRAGRGFLGRDAFLVNLLAGLHSLGIDRGDRARNLPGKVVGESLDLVVTELVAYSPHVLETFGVGTMMIPEIVQLRDEIAWLLTRKPGEIGRHRVAVDAMAIRANLDGGHFRT